MGRAMLSKSLVKFSVDGWGCVPSLLLTWDQTMEEVMKIMVTSFKRSHACTATLSAPNPAAGHRWPTPLPDTPGHLWTSLGQSLVGSLLLGPGVHRFCLCPPRVFPQSCVSSGSSMVGLMATSSKLEIQKSASRFYIQESPRVVGNQESPLFHACAHTHFSLSPSTEAAAWRIPGSYKKIHWLSLGHMLSGRGLVGLSQGTEVLAHAFFPPLLPHCSPGAG